MTSGDFVLIVSSTLLNHFVQMIGIFFVQNLKQWFSEAECKKAILKILTYFKRNATEPTERS